MTRILMTGSRDFGTRGAAPHSDAQHAEDFLQAALMMTGSRPQDAVLVHGGARGADQLLARTAERIGMRTEEHRASWSQHGDDCPPSHAGLEVCKKAGHRRNAEMIASGIDLVLAFPTHGYALAPGEDRANTSRGTWDCADKAKRAGLPVLVLFGKDGTCVDPRVFPYGAPALALMQAEATKKRLQLGVHGSLALLDALLPF